MLSIVAFLMQSCFVSHNKIHTDFFDTDDFKNNSQYVSINVPTFLAKSYVRKSLKKANESKEVLDLVKKIKDVKVLVVGQSKTNVRKDFQNFLDRNKYEEWMSIHQEGQLIRLNASNNNDVINRMIISVNDNDESVYVDVKGNFSADDISKIINASEKGSVKFRFKNKDLN